MPSPPFVGSCGPVPPIFESPGPLTGGPPILESPGAAPGDPPVGVEDPPGYGVCDPLDR